MNTHYAKGKAADGSPETVFVVRILGEEKTYRADGNFTEAEMMQKFAAEIQLWTSERILATLLDVAFRLQMKGSI